MNGPGYPGAQQLDGGPAPHGIRSIPFDEREARDIRMTSSLMYIAGGLGILKGLLDLAVQALSAVVTLSKPAQAGLSITANICGGLLTAGVAVLLGVWLFIGGSAFRRVVDTDGADQLHLVHGLRQLRNVFLLKSLLIIGMFVLACCGFFLANTSF